MIQIPSPGGYDKLVYTPLSDGKYTEGANIKLEEDIKEEDLVIVKTHACGVNAPINSKHQHPPPPPGQTPGI